MFRRKKLLLLLLGLFCAFQFAKKDTYIRNLFQSKNPKKDLFCLLIISEHNLKKALEFFPIWASRCDNHTFITLITESTYPQAIKGHRIEIKYKDTLNILQPEGFVNDTFKALTNKVYRGFLDIAQHHGDYKWYLKADIDTFIFMDNLEEFLGKQNSSFPVSFGYNFKPQYQSGGAGYVLSNEALKRFGSALSPINSTCPDTGIEDMDVGKCLRSIQVDMGKSIDGRRERFHVESVQNHFNNKKLGWLKGWSQNVYLPGYSCCSDTSISYHRQTLSEMKLMKELWSRELTFKDFYDAYSGLRQHLPKFVNSSSL